ncbi:MAG: zinc-binding dehydrogenase [Polynucleobacter sp.]|nr:zinc-binding dehydrogenase [Polynucleobacter sp.]
MKIPEKMRAAILVEQLKPLVVTEVQLPKKIDIGQVLVKIHYSGICGSQLGEIDGAKGPDPYLPHLLGHEASGVVVDVGPGVKHVKSDDIVVLHWRKGLGIEGSPPEYLWGGNKLNAGWIATFNEYAVVAENRLTVIPSDSDMQVAALFGCAVTTGFGVVENNAKLKIGESVVVFGAGGVGLNIVQAASLVSAYPIIAVDLFDGRLQLAKKMGATHLINVNAVNAKETIESILGVNGLDCFIDNTGNPSVIELGYQITKTQGRVVLVGVPKKGKNISLYSLPLHFGKTISGSQGGEATPQVDIPRYHHLYSNGRLKLNELITEVYPLDDINLAIDRMRSGAASGRCLIKMS